MTRTVKHSFSGRRPGRARALGCLAPLFLGFAAARAQEPAAAPAYEKEVYLLYTVNNLGYTDVCG